MVQKLLKHGQRYTALFEIRRLDLSFWLILPDMRFVVTLFSMILLMAASPAIAQKKVLLQKGAGIIIGSTINGQQVQRIIDNVSFKQGTTTIYCDSAWFYKAKNSMEAFGHVRIVEGDSVTITAARLEYDGNARKAKLRNNVVFTKLATAKLFTDYLDYDRNANEAYYYNGGKLVDSINTLTSKKGYYQVNSNLASFKKDVNVANPDYTMTADSLQYNSKNKVIYFVSETTVVDKDSTQLVYKSGNYNTITRTSDLKEGLAQSQRYELKGNSYDLDDLRKMYKLRGDVVMTYKDENLTIFGQSADYFRSKNIAKIYNRAFVAKVTDEGDTLFMTADTLVSIDNVDPAKKRLLAYNNVKIFKRDLQGVADSLEYRSADSTIYFYKNPVLWSEGNQMTADSIRILIEKNTLSKIFMVSKAFVISKDTLGNFNQIKGRNMTAEFRAGRLNRVNVEGNGESLYFALDEKTHVLTGMNKIICSNIIIRFLEGKVNNLSFYVKPEANFIPPHELNKEDTELEGFRWKESEKPQKKEVIKTEIEEINPEALPRKSFIQKNRLQKSKGEGAKREEQ
jgi:lipopolysaccharide export system protein LptA